MRRPGGRRRSGPRIRWALLALLGLLLWRGSIPLLGGGGEEGLAGDKEESLGGGERNSPGEAPAREAGVGKALADLLEGRRAGLRWMLEARRWEDLRGRLRDLRVSKREADRVLAEEFRPLCEGGLAAEREALLRGADLRDGGRAFARRLEDFGRRAPNCGSALLLELARRLPLSEGRRLPPLPLAAGGALLELRGRRWLRRARGASGWRFRLESASSLDPSLLLEGLDALGRKEPRTARTWIRRLVPWLVETRRTALAWRVLGRAFSLGTRREDRRG